MNLIFKESMKIYTIKQINSGILLPLWESLNLFANVLVSIRKKTSNISEYKFVRDANNNFVQQ